MKKWKVPASVSLAQYGIESGWGAKAPGNNPFGIKHMSGYPDQMFHTHEQINGKLVPKDLVFAKFDTIAQAFDAHAQLIATRPQYAKAIAMLPNLKAFVNALGPVYATSSGYADLVLKIIGQNGFVKYDTVAS